MLKVEDPGAEAERYPRRPVASIVVHYKHCELTARAVTTLLASTYPRHLILVVDNGSRDGNALVELTRAEGVELLSLPDNIGFAAGVNRGADEAIRRWDPEFLFLLNNDAEVEPGAIASLVRTADLCDAAFVGPKILAAATESATPPRPRLWAAGGDLRRWSLMAQNRGAGEVDTGRYDAMQAQPFLSACALLIHRNAWERLGGFDPVFFLFQEDVDLCLRADQHRLHLVYEPSARVTHEGSSTAGGEYGMIQSYHRWRNRLYLFSRHSRGLHRLFLFFLFFPCLAARDFLRYLLHGHWRELRPLFAGLSEFLLGRNRMTRGNRSRA